MSSLNDLGSATITYDDQEIEVVVKPSTTQLKIFTNLLTVGGAVIESGTEPAQSGVLWWKP